ncbi:DUF2235 domain-containing protein [Rhodanobacter sp. AS-Z3]|uniref:DUF2235 domain-containing protein n=1 Tax=Rhodanobacter sp. AS-Z3 TaxID=3031330 RepID=UPI002478F336|nr:DUF2235 domain-containing protein [Rhodanobacter sp. AS-Z3]WEN16895.1 DUF2235 domain-containing protein [Rhodanobacter sp. AS-Z3]
MRRLVLLFDGTWNKPESNTNVERLRRLIAPVDDDGNLQMVNYIPGVGVKRGLTHLLGGAFGYGLSDNVIDGYRWLCENWQAGDQIHLFGFSRGAYTARSLGGLIRKCGLLRCSSNASVAQADVDAAYDFYRNLTSKPDDPAAVEFRADHSIEVDIHFIGVWDTVGSLGIPDTASWFPYARARYQFHDTELSKIVKYAYQALALDEHRADFSPAVWTRNPYTVKAGESLTSKKVEQIEIEQRWFIGSHSDVGGGNDRDGAGRKPDPLPDLPLAWLQRKAMDAGLCCNKSWIPAEDANSGMPRDSYKEFMSGLYKEFKSPIDRLLGTGVNERVDDSVWRRWLADASYRPPSLVRALANATVLMSIETVVPPARPPKAWGDAR